MGITLPLFRETPERLLADFEQILLSNSGEDAFEVAVELMTVKLLSEFEESEGAEPTFKLYGTPAATHDKIAALYRRAAKRWPNLVGQSAILRINPEHLVRALRPLLGWKLMGSDLTHLDAMLEHLVSKDSKGSLGQYFTPREVIRMCVKILHPLPTDKIIDPACGSAGFLFEASRQSLTEFNTAPKCLGIDFGSRAAKVATLLCAAAPQYSILFSKANSLDGRSYLESYPEEWDEFLQSKSNPGPDEVEWGAWSRLRCNVLFANPPFAGDIDDHGLLKAYESLQLRRSTRTVSREHLFLERAVRLLAPGGRMAIVLPQGVFSNASSAYLRHWLFSKVRVLGVIGLHPFTFLPHTNVKTSVLFVERRDVESDDNYHIFFATSKRPGKDSSGRRVEVDDYDSIAAQFSAFLSTEGAKWARKTPKPSERGGEVVRVKEVLRENRFDAEFFDSAARESLKKLRQEARGSIQDYVHKDEIERFRAKKHRGEIGYIDISAVDYRTGLITPSWMSAEEAPSRASFIVRPSDILVSLVRPERGVIGFVTSFGNATMVASNGFCVLRAIREKIEPEVLFAFCKSNQFRQLLARAATASMYPTVNESDVLELPIPLPSLKRREKIRHDLQAAMEAIQNAYRSMEEAIASIDKN